MIDVNTIDTILIPDVHGRKFWLEATPYIEKGVRTIFMGDYLDPYPHEGVTKAEAIEGFEEILSYKDYNNVAFLLGNHDCGYRYDFEICNCRTDRRNVRKIQQLFWDNATLFKLCSLVGENCIVSHAGIHKGWYGHIKGSEENDTPQEIVENVNKLLVDYPYRDMIDLLSWVSRQRGGYCPVGSVVWADIREWNEYTPPFIPRQIVGHTMQIEARRNEKGEWLYRPTAPLHNVLRNITCIDCQHCFYLDKEGDLRYLDTGEVAVK